MNDCEIIVCEKTGRWAAALRRALGFSSGLCETRSWAACLREVRARPAALVALEVLPENAEAACQRLVELTWQSPHVSAIVMADRSLSQSEWLLREAGAVHVLFSPDEWSRLRLLFRKFTDQLPASRTTFREHVWSSLPWPRHTTNVSEKSVIKKGSENGQRPN
jgi:hypothetical protein